jgi:cellulose synthase/poly-beta-1,6-N-acetylglucosamine synthase-like glycosyltransferase
MMPHAQHDLYVLVALLLVCLTAPLLAEVLTLTLAAMAPVPSPAPPILPALERLIVLVPSHNEGLNIARCVQSVAGSAGSQQDILVIAHNCIDSTAANARTAGATVSELNDPNLVGKGSALEHGFRLAFQQMGADAVMIIDADSTVSTNLVPLVRQRLQSSSVLQCRYQCRSDLNPKSRLRALAFFCMNVVRPMGRNRLHLSSGIFGNGFALRREILERVPYDAHSIVEDLEFHLALVSAGVFCDFVGDARVWGEVPTSTRGAATQSARWEGGRFRMFRAHVLPLLVQVLRGRTSLIEPLLDLAGVPLAIEVLSLCLLVLVPIHVVRLYALFGFAILALHLLFAIFSGPDPAADLCALTQVPAYILSKLRMLPAILRTGRDRAAWIRTSRT